MFIKLHSVTDLITNSSTTIYTYSENSENALKLMVNEIFRIFDINKTCDDVFDTVVMYRDFDQYYYSTEGGDKDLLPEDLKNLENPYDAITEICHKVEKGEIPKPEWMNKIEEYNDENQCDNYSPSTRLYLIPKDDKSRELAKLIENFLYSTSHEACRDG